MRFTIKDGPDVISAYGESYTLIDFTENEEREIAIVTYDMLRRMFRLRDVQKDFLDSSFWFGRAGHAASLTVKRFEEWLDCVDEYDSYGPYMGEPLLNSKMVGLTIGMERAREQQFTSMPGTLKDVKKRILTIWKEEWNDHPIRTSHERYKEWPYPNQQTLLNEQGRRIMIAERTEKAFWKASWNTNQGDLNDHDFYRYIRETYKVGPDHLLEMDRDAWEIIKKAIAKELGIPKDAIHDLDPPTEGKEYEWKKLDPFEDADEIAMRKAAKKYGYVDG